MNYQTYILNKAIDKYERSHDYQIGKKDGRVLLKLNTLPELQDVFDNVSDKSMLFHELHDMERNELIDIIWVRFEEENLIDRIYLKDINRAYILLKRLPKEDIVSSFHTLMENYISRMEEFTLLKQYLQKLNMDSLEKKRIPVGFDDDLTLDEDILRFLLFINGNKQIQMERVISVSLYGDSKYFERVIRPKVLAILRRIHLQETEELAEDSELLEEQGVARWPEIMEFSGDLNVTMDDGTLISYEKQPYGSYLNSAMVSHIQTIDTSDITRILSIENKANYTWYVLHAKRKGELILYHGGVYSPSKGKWFSLIKQGLNSNAEVYHWSDIDVGGFRIFSRLANNVFSQLKPYRMDVPTLAENMQKCLPLGSEHYRMLLREMQCDERYYIFKDVIGYMLNYNVKLEQENLICENKCFL